jgi:pterin-4a-carbinolamine dehydratase
MAHSVFISYRRSDSQIHAVAVAQALTAAFADGEVFLDRFSLVAGLPWPDELVRGVSQARVVVALIGPKWLMAHDESGTRRLDLPEDWVRQELVLALEAGIRIVPVLLDDAALPADLKLTGALAPFAQLQRLAVRSDHWIDDLNALIKLLNTAPDLAVPLRAKPAADGLTPHGRPVLNGNRPAPQQSRRKVLSHEQIVQALYGLPGWREEQTPHPWALGGMAHELCNEFIFASFLEATRFMATVAPAFDKGESPHHPRWEQQWRVVKVWFSTWDVGCRITDLDVKAAREISLLYFQHRSTNATEP